MQLEVRPPCSEPGGGKSRIEHVNATTDPSTYPRGTLRLRSYPPHVTSKGLKPRLMSQHRKTGELALCAFQKCLAYLSKPRIAVSCEPVRSGQLFMAPARMSPPPVFRSVCLRSPRSLLWTQGRGTGGTSSAHTWTTPPCKQPSQRSTGQHRAAKCSAQCYAQCSAQCSAAICPPTQQ